MVLVASNIVISSRFSVTTAPVLSSTYPPPLLAVKKSSPPLPPFPRPSPTAGALHCCRSPSITTIALQDRHLPLASDLQRCLPVSSTCLGSIPFRDSQASNLRIYVLHVKSLVISVVCRVPQARSTHQPRIGLDIASSDV
ncbi:hypothetical protein DY000_02053455 [Brassica cretica]|uniref:Uncharacterized protein n=1 Tax=Brassica cretica TaxID=69181 RepID=A0ABQ7AIU2_BRACR|nr:hypothetical protein DY000_02053455 [Brassica cretica]